MRIAIVGSREFSDLKAVRQFVWELERDSIVVSGGARGVDTVAIDEAKRLGMMHEVYPADWNLHGRSAGVIRNRRIVEAAEEIVAFWDGKSRGTKSTIDYAKRAGKPVRIIYG